ncbi:hypothetical protein GFW62_08175 [Salmonella enterica]|nr:hypothetical protein [Salmonella enterica]
MTENQHVRCTPEELRTSVIRELTDIPPQTDTDRCIREFISRWPAFNGGWLLFFAAHIQAAIKNTNSNNILLLISTDKNQSWMQTEISGSPVPALPVPDFCDFFIRRQQFIAVDFRPTPPE